MSIFELLVIITYLYAVFVLQLESKVTYIKAGITKIIFLVLSLASLYFLITEQVANLPLWLRIVVYLPVIYLIFMIFTEDIYKFAKKTGLKSSRDKTYFVNNDLADHLYQAVEFLSKNQIGALITVERNDDLSKIVNKALMLNADVSKELLTSIFIPNAPLHDGAVIIRGDKILCAKAYYP